MNWTYFLEHENESPFSSPNAGSCGNLLTLDFSGSTCEQDITVALLSHSILLNGEKIVSEWRLINKQLELSLKGFEEVIHVLQLTMRNKEEVYISRLALLPTTALPQACIVVGSPRSGTTAVGNMVQQAFETRAHGEAHLAELFSNLIHQSEEFLENGPAANSRGTLVWEVPSVFVKAQLVKQLRDVYTTYNANGVILDKTPGIPMLQALPILILAFPNAKVVYCQRRGIENVASRLRKFPNTQFEAHCEQWTQTVFVWQRLKKQISRLIGCDDWWIEVEQFDLATSPQQVTKALGSFLSLNEFAVTRMFEYQEKKTPEITSGKPSDVSSLDAVNWTDAQKQIFTRVCGETMKQQGYTTDVSYYTKRTL